MHNKIIPFVVILLINDMPRVITSFEIISNVIIQSENISFVVVMSIIIPFYRQHRQSLTRVRNFKLILPSQLIALLNNKMKLLLCLQLINVDKLFTRQASILLPELKSLRGIDILRFLINFNRDHGFHNFEKPLQSRLID